MNKREAEIILEKGITWKELIDIVSKMSEEGKSKVNPQFPKSYVKNLFLKSLENKNPLEKVNIESGSPFRKRSADFFIARNILMEQN